MGFTPVVLVLLQAPLLATARDSPALLSTEKHLPEPYGHTANIAPHAPNTDREWYTEYRWKKGQEYKPQDGIITNKPVFAPVPKPTPAPKKKFLRQPLNKKPKEEPKPEEPKKTTKVKVEEKHAKLPKEKPEAAEPAAVKAKKEEKEPKKKPEKAAAEKEVEAKPKKSKKAVTPPGVGAPEKKPPEPRYAVPKPCGHTSQVHPYNWKNDREWYTEYRWKEGSEYKIQDGPITEKPVGANKIIQTFPVENDCDPHK